MWQEFRDWIVPGIAVGTLLWQAFTALRRNVVKPEDLAKFATTNDMMAVEKVLHDQVDECDRRITEADHKIDLLTKDVGALPNYSDVNRLREAISELTANVSKLSADMHGLDSTVDRMGSSVDRVEQHLLNLKLAKVVE